MKNLAGTLECGEENISDRHDALIGDRVLAELWGVWMDEVFADTSGWASFNLFDY